MSLMSFKQCLFHIPLAFCLFLIRSYRRCVSPHLGSPCRFFPSCSEYALHAIALHHYKGLWLMIKRLGKCGPWHPGGVDFVPGTSIDLYLDDPAALETSLDNPAAILDSDSSIPKS